LYNRRDNIGHYVDKTQATHRHCTHACCRGYREHPEHWPVVLPSRKLRGASDEQLAEHFRRITWEDTGKPQNRRAELQILHEMERRDRAEERDRDRARVRDARAANQAAARQEREAEYERVKLDAEAHTVGYLVNAKGRARGIADREILTGRRDVFDRYASDEAKDYFRTHARPTAGYFRGQDTRAAPRAPLTRRGRVRVR
jgi:hypothetical protein